MRSYTDASPPPLRTTTHGEANVDRYSVIASDLHRPLVAGIPAHCERFCTLSFYTRRVLAPNRRHSRICTRRRFWGQRIPSAARSFRMNNIGATPTTEKGPQEQPVTARAKSIVPRNLAIYIPLVVPVMLFVVSLSIPPTIDWDSGIGLIVLRSMLEGGAFNILTVPDHADISRDLARFLSLWSPGQYI